MFFIYCCNYVALCSGMSKTSAYYRQVYIADNDCQG